MLTQADRIKAAQARSSAGMPSAATIEESEATKEGAMTDPNTLPISEPTRHTTKIATRLQELADHLREDVGKVEDPQAKALFETAAEVLLGLRNAFVDYEKGDEEAWRPSRN